MRRPDPAAPARRVRRARRAADEWLTPAAPIPMYPDLRFGLARRRPCSARFEQSAPISSTSRRPGRSPGRRCARRARSASPTTSDFRTNFHQYTRHYRLGFLLGAALGLLRRFHNLTDRTFVPTRADGRELGGRRLRATSPSSAAASTPCASSRRGAAPSCATRWGAAETTPVLLTVGRVAAEKNIELALRAFEAARRARPARAWSWSATARCASASQPAHPDGPLRRRAARRRAGRALRVGRRVPVFPASPTPSATSRSRRWPPACRWWRSTCAAPAEHVEDGRSGRLVVPGDEAAFIEAVGRLAVAPDAAARRCARRRWQAARRARWDDILARFEAHLQNAVDCARSALRRCRPGFLSGSSLWIERERLVRASGCTARRRATGSCACWTSSAGSATAGSGTPSILALPWLDRRDRRVRPRSACSRSARSTSSIYLIIKRWIARPRPYRACPGIRECDAAARRVQLPERPHAALGRLQPRADPVYYPVLGDRRLAVRRC